jgi:hypothetical protein
VIAALRQTILGQYDENQMDKAYSTHAQSEPEGKGSLAVPRRRLKDIRMDL